MTEVEVLSHVEQWLAGHGFACYPEVPVRGGRVDMVAVRDNVTWIVEAKVGLSLALVAQAVTRRGLADGVLLAHAIPPMLQGARRATGPAPDGTHAMLASLGLGWCTVMLPYHDTHGGTWTGQRWSGEDHPARVTLVVPPRVERPVGITPAMKPYLTEAHRSLASAPGSVASKVWTPFKGLRDAVHAVLKGASGPLTSLEIAALVRQSAPDLPYCRSEAEAKRTVSSYLSAGYFGSACACTGRKGRLNQYAWREPAGRDA